MNIISRQEAREAGKLHYFTGRSCKYGHISKRLVSTRRCGGCSYVDDHKRYARDLERERTRSRVYQRRNLPEPTRPVPEACELCGNLPRRRVLHLDHDHISGEFRGWLCTTCNTGLGKLGDDINGLQRAMDYLKGVLHVSTN